jgi:trimethylamine--corrinoid protein Co-methyltransferase
MTGGIGLLQGAGLMSLPQLVIDDEIARMIARILEGVEVSADTLMPGMMERVGLDGTYLSEKDTSRRLRAGEVFLPLVADRRSYEHWDAAGTTELETANARVTELTGAAAERGPLLDDAQLAGLHAYADEAAAAAPR